MVKTHKNSRFALLTLTQIRDTKDVILQAEDTHTNFEGGQKCYLCEIVAHYEYNRTQTDASLVSEICTLNSEKRKLEKRISKLEKRLEAIKSGG